MTSSPVMDAVVALARGQGRARPADLAAALTCVRHYLACAFAGRDLDWSRAALRLASDERSHTGAIVIGLGERSHPRAAVFANAVLGQSTLAEDVHPASLVHPGSVVIPAALACAEATDATGADFLGAVIAG